MKTLLLKISLLLVCVSWMSPLFAAPSETVDEVWSGVVTKLWTEPNKFGSTIAQLEPGVKLKVIKYTTAADWMLVTTPAGREGWVLVRHTTQDQRRVQPLVSQAQLADAANRNPASTEGAAPVAAQTEKQWQFLVVPSFTLRVKPATAFGGGLGTSALYNLGNGFRAGAGFFWGIISDVDTGGGVEVSAFNRAHLQLGPMASYQSGPMRIFGLVGWDHNNINLKLTDTTTGLELGTTDGITPGTYNEDAIGMRLGAAGKVYENAEGIRLELGVSWAMGFYGGTSLVPDQSGSMPQQIDFFAAIVF